MKFRSSMFFALAAIVAIIMSTGTAANAQSLNLSDVQVLQIQAMLSAQTTEMQSLHANVQAARETLNAATAAGDPVRMARAVLSLDAAEKALKLTQTKNQVKLLSVLNPSQKQTVESAGKSVRTSD